MAFATSLRAVRRGLRGLSTLPAGLRLYRGAADPSSRRVKVALAELGVSDAVEHVVVDIGAKENRGDAFVKQTGTNQLPVLALPGGEYLSESLAICRYLNDSTDGALFGAGALEAARVESALYKLTLGLGACVTGGFQHTQPMFADRIVQVPEWGRHCILAAPGKVDDLEAAMSDGRDFVCGAALTMADIHAVVALDFARVLQVRLDAAKHPNLAAWHARMKKRPSYK
ncbi:hypothetical protein M885DRAFT_526007 [Pelagophyceae sp. CCMP2097]|nr:hypothetical protein M885DRAFT_526007 [Pelagophyceae sp. CCMP2097]